MINCKRTNSSNPDFQKLVEKLDAELKIRDGDEHSFYKQFNKIDSLKNAVVAYRNNEPVGCGAFKKYSEQTAELKRMFVPLSGRGQGIATLILKELENWALELGFRVCILETGIRQPEAIALYKKNGYISIPNFGQYKNMGGSVCFEKLISSKI